VDTPAELDIAGLRETYRRGQLSEGEVADEPLAQFRRWLGEAVSARVPEPNAMTLATASPDGVPAARVVLLKAVDEAGFVFYTNTGSAKAVQLLANPHAALVFCWLELERQVRVVGSVTAVDRISSASYFASRPRQSQLGAWASHQSTVVADRDELVRAEQQVSARFARRLSSSGRAARAGCTTGCVTATTGPGGWLSASLPETSAHPAAGPGTQSGPWALPPEPRGGDRMARRDESRGPRAG